MASLHLSTSNSSGNSKETWLNQVHIKNSSDWCMRSIKFTVICFETSKYYCSVISTVSLPHQLVLAMGQIKPFGINLKFIVILNRNRESNLS